MEIELSILYEKRVSSFWLSPELFNRHRTDIATTKKSMTHILRNSDFTYGTLKAQGFSGGSMVKNPPTSAGDVGSVLGSGRSSAVGNGNPLQYSCLGSPMDRGAF